MSKPKFDIQQFRAELKEAARQACELARRDLAGQRIVGYALYSDTDATSVSVTINTATVLAKKQGEDDPEDEDYDPLYYRWSPAEWAREGVGDAIFRNLNQRLRVASEASNIKTFRPLLFKACVAVLEELNKEGFFGPRTDDVVVVFAASDYMNKPIEKGWMARLNPAPLAEEFVQWLVTA